MSVLYIFNPIKIFFYKKIAFWYPIWLAFYLPPPYQIIFKYEITIFDFNFLDSSVINKINRPNSSKIKVFYLINTSTKLSNIYQELIFSD